MAASFEVQFIHHDTSARQRQRLQHTHVGRYITRRQKSQSRRVSRNVLDLRRTRSSEGNHNVKESVDVSGSNIKGSVLRTRAQDGATNRKAKWSVIADTGGSVHVEAGNIRRNDQNGSAQSCETLFGAYDASISTSTIHPRYPLFSSLPSQLDALHIPTLHLTSPELFKHMINTQINIIWPRYPTSFDRKLRLRLICEEPLMLHTYALTTAVHHDALIGRPCWSCRPEIAVHLSQVVQLLNHSLSDVRPNRIELLLMVIILLPITNLDWHHASLQHGTSLLRPISSTQRNWAAVWGRILHSDTYVRHSQRALFELVAQLGGLDNVTAIGLREQLLLADLFFATRLHSKPLFPCFWPRGVMLHADQGGQCQRPGRDPANRAVGTLPETMWDLLEELNVATRLAEDEHGADSIKLGKEAVLAASYAVHHRALSLRAWNELISSERSQTSRIAYELTRNTAQLYSSAVVLGLPPHSGWHIPILQEILLLLDSERRGDTQNLPPSLRIWVLMIASIVSYFTTYKSVFQAHLRQALLLAKIMSWNSVQQVASQFLWSCRACEQGVVVFWEAMQPLHHYGNGTDTTSGIC